MIKKLYQLVLGRQLELRERIFRVIVLLGGTMALLGVLECLILMNEEEIVIPLGFLLVIMAIAFMMTFKMHRMEEAAVIVGLAVIVVVFPDMFFYSGGLGGGATVWFVLGLFYVFVMFTGRRFVFFLILTLAVDCITYWVAYRYPGSVTPMISAKEAYLDSIFAVIVVGIAVGTILKFQMKIFETERGIVTEQKDELEKVSKSKNEFFANMSHEIRTPINTIIGLDELILREDLSVEAREYAQNIGVAGDMLLTLVNDILDLSEMEIKRMEIVPARYRTKELFEELIEMIHASIKVKKLDLLVDIDGNIPSVLQGDEKRIKQVMLNVLTNAVKYTAKGSVTLSAHMERLDDPGMIRLKIAVSDTGIGIRKEELEYLYDSFRPIQDRKGGHVSGGGLGLSIAKQLLDLMGGDITVDSIYTKGSVFTVTLDQRVVQATPIGNVKFLERGASDRRVYYRQSFEAPEARILLVEGDEMSAMVVRRLLAPTKVQVDIASDGEECLEKTRQRFYHVILMEYIAPGTGAADTLKELRRQENGLCRDSAVVILTANIATDARQVCEEYGFDGYLEKPIQTAKLEEEILRFLPEDIVEYRLYENDMEEPEEGLSRRFGRKRKRVYVTSDCACDLSDELLEKYDIKLMYFYIQTKGGRFADTREIDSDSFSHYLTQEGSEVHTDSVSVEEYEEFFADVLTEAEHVIHISVSEHVGQAYEVASIASSGFDHVHLIDSGHISGAEGILVLCAAQMAMKGEKVEDICAELERVRDRVRGRYLMPNTRYLLQNGKLSPAVSRFFEVMKIHPSFRMSRGRLVLVGGRTGDMERAWKQFVRLHLIGRRRIDRGIMIITHVGLSVRQQDMIREEVLKRVPFEKVIVQRASFTIACSSGMYAIGMAFYMD